jgi:hypothetical protein
MVSPKKNTIDQKTSLWTKAVSMMQDRAWWQEKQDRGRSDPIKNRQEINPQEPVLDPTDLEAWHQARISRGKSGRVPSIQ